MNQNKDYIIITAGSTYLDIDAYACAVAMAELLRLKGINAIAYSKAPCNYSICNSLIKDSLIARELPTGFDEDNAKYIIVDVSDPDFLAKSVPLEKITEVYDHHAGFEEYWTSRIDEGAHIEFIGAAATLIYREWKKAGLEDKMSPPTARLLIAAILDNTLNLTSANTTEEDRVVYRELCEKIEDSEEFPALYFSEVQKTVEADLKNALFGDVKSIRDNPILPSCMGQIAVWDSDSILARTEEICLWFDSSWDSWMLNIIDIQHNCNYFICSSREHQRKIEQIFDVHFKSGIAKTALPYLRKEIIKKSYFGSNF